MLCMLPLGSIHAQTQCTYWGDFNTQAKTQMITLNQPSENKLSIAGQLLYRPLKQDETSYWLGLQLVSPQVEVDQQTINAALYGVPFAVKVNAKTKLVSDYHFAGKLKPADQQKLIAIYHSLHSEHLHQADLSEPMVRKESDDLGQYTVSYALNHDKSITRSKVNYLTTKQSGNMFDFALPDVIDDEFILKLDHCGLRALQGENHTSVQTKKGDIKVAVEQKVQFKVNPAPIPGSTLLLTLDDNPLKWPMLSEHVLYPRPPANPLKDANAFIAALKGLDISNLTNEQLGQLLYDNQIYLASLKQLIKSQELADKMLSKLFLMVGKNDSSYAHQLLVDVYLDPDIAGKQRFRSLMGLKYAEQPLAPELVDQILDSAQQQSEGEQKRLSNSALMVLGVIAKNQSGSEFSSYVGERLAQQLKQTSDARRQVSILAALGNSGDSAQQDKIADYLNSSDTRLRTQAAESLGKMPNQESLNYITDQLGIEQDKNTQAALLRAMGNNELDSKQIDGLFSFSQSQPQQVRLAAIEALAQQAKTEPKLKARLKMLVKSEKDQQVQRALMKAVYGG